MLAPNHVSAPAATHTSRIPAKLGTARLTSDGWTKIEEPTIVPTTIAVACVRPIERASDEGIDARPEAFALRVSIVSCPHGVRRRQPSEQPVNRITGQSAADRS